MCDCVNQCKVCHTETIQEIGDNHGRFHPQLARTGVFYRITRLDTIKREIKKGAIGIILLFLGLNTSCLAGVEAEESKSELELEFQEFSGKCKSIKIRAMERHVKFHSFLSELFTKNRRGPPNTR